MDEVLYVIGCMPCVHSMSLGFLPYEDSTVGKCSRCNVEVWVGPEQRKQIKAHGYPIICYICILKEQGPEALENMISLSDKRST